MKLRSEVVVGGFTVLASVACGETAAVKPSVATPVDAPRTSLTALPPSPPPPTVMERATTLCDAAKATLQACQAAGNVEAARAASDAGRAACAGATMLKAPSENPKFDEGFVAEKLQGAEASMAAARRLGPDCAARAPATSVAAATASPTAASTDKLANAERAPRRAKVVKLEIIALEEPQSASVRIGDTLEITMPLSTGTEWKIVGDQPASQDFVQGYLGPNTDGVRYVWKVAGASGKRMIKFVGTNANTPKAAPDVVKVDVTVE